jgi:hypothetical protein
MQEPKNPDNDSQNDIMIDFLQMEEQLKNEEVVDDEVTKKINCINAKIQMHFNGQVRREFIEDKTENMRGLNMFSDHLALQLTLKNIKSGIPKSMLTKSLADKGENSFWEKLDVLAIEVMKDLTDERLLKIRTILERGAQIGYLKKAKRRYAYKLERNVIPWHIHQFLSADTRRKQKIRAGIMLQILKYLFP